LCDYGSKNGNQCDVSTLPGIHADIARRVLDAIAQGAEGFAGIYPHFTTAPEGLRTEFIECNEVYSPRPEHCGPLLEIIAKHHRAFHMDVLADRLRVILERGDNPANILREIAKLEAECAPVNHSLRAILKERAFNFALAPLPPYPLLKLGGDTITTPGNLTNVQAGIKAGKTAALGAIIAAICNGNRQGPDTLGFDSENPEGYAVIHIDTEQSRYDHDALIRRALRRAQVNEPPTWLLSYCLTDIDVAARLNALGLLLEDAVAAHGGIFLVIIDGVADLSLDPNDPKESFALVGYLHATAIKYNCGVITVLHENPGSETGKTRGHLGSQLERKAETNLRLAKDAAGVTTVWSDRARHGHTPRDQGTCFQWSDAAGMHVSCGTAREIKATAKQAKFRDEAEAAFGDAEKLGYSDLVTRIMEAVGVVAKTAEKRVKTYSAEGLIVKSSEGIYTLKS
jgi:hypothetical protein